MVKAKVKEKKMQGLTFTTANILEKVIFVSNRNIAPFMFIISF